MVPKAIPISEAKAKFSELARRAGMGEEVISVNKHSKSAPVSLIKTDILTSALAAMKYTLTETEDAELNILTIAVKEIPVYGEGSSKEEAIEALTDAVLDYLSVYEERIELFNQVDTPETQGYVLKLRRCGTDRQAIRETLGL